MEISPEFRFAVKCCRWSFSGGTSQKIEPPSEIDWSRLVRLVRFHRIQGLVWNCLASVGNGLPQSVVEALTADSRAIAADNLRSAVKCRELLADFERAGIGLLFVKGLTLGALAYGDIALKSGVDIDLLVPEDQLGEAAGILSSRGCHLVDPAGGASADQLRAWHRPRKESLWARRNSQIDLHTRLADNPRMIPSVGIGSPRQTVEVCDGIRLPTLAADELFAYLAVHGASSVWFRLKWITDLAALLSRSVPSDLDRLHRRSQELGAGRAAAQALLLADALYGTLNDFAVLRDRLARDRASRWLFRAALNQMCGNSEMIEPTSRPLGTAIIHLSQLALLPGPGFKFRELVRQAQAALG